MSRLLRQDSQKSARRRPKVKEDPNLRGSKDSFFKIMSRCALLQKGITSLVDNTSEQPRALQAGFMSMCCSRESPNSLLMLNCTAQYIIQGCLSDDYSSYSSVHLIGGQLALHGSPQNIAQQAQWHPLQICQMSETRRAPQEI